MFSAKNSREHYFINITVVTFLLFSLDMVSLSHEASHIFLEPSQEDFSSSLLRHWGNLKLAVVFLCPI